MYSVRHPWFKHTFRTEKELYESCKDMKGLYDRHIVKDKFDLGYTLGDLVRLHSQ